VRTLVVATEYPWPPNSGSRLRLANTLEALSRLGPTELFSAVSATRADFADPPPSSELARTERIAIDDAPPGVVESTRRLFRPSLPFTLPQRARATTSRALHRFATGGYDLVWYFQVRAWVLADWHGATPAVVDIDDLEDEKILARAALAPDEAGLVRRLRRATGRRWTKEEARRWRALHHRIAERVDATVLCSELDARRSGLTGVRVVPNGYPPPVRPVGKEQVSVPPVVLFQGTLRYPPNADAARFLVRDVGPRLRALAPRAQIRLVGLAPPALAPLADPPDVTLAGQVADMVDELALADVVVVPVRYASGTRVKILEAFAHRLPVVATTVGAEGLEAVAGEHLLVADDAEDIARACARLLQDAALRKTIVDNAHALYLSRYQASRAQEAVCDVAHSVVAR
jgi:glycosyltransferase involved in cell wall biosynthesis